MNIYPFEKARIRESLLGRKVNWPSNLSRQYVESSLSQLSLQPRSLYVRSGLLQWCRENSEASDTLNRSPGVRVVATQFTGWVNRATN